MSKAVSQSPTRVKPCMAALTHVLLGRTRFFRIFDSSSKPFPEHAEAGEEEEEEEEEEFFFFVAE